MSQTHATLSTFALLFAATLFSTTGAVSDPVPQDSKDGRATLTFDVYALETCPISNEKLGSMGDPVVKNVDGREVRFCCAGCVEQFESDQQRYFAEIDKALVEQQSTHYALDVCPVSGRALAESDTVVDIIHEGRLVRFCCPGCPNRFKADPDRYMKKLDEAVIKQQRENYPLHTCVVGESKLGSMGTPYEIIVGGTLVRFCCEGCIGGFKENPAKHLAAIREAWKRAHESVE